MRVLICGYNLYGYLDSISEGFKKNKSDVWVFSHANISIRKLKSKNPIKKVLAWYRLRKINNSLKRCFLKYMPEIVLCINASSLFCSTINFLSNRSLTILWLVDSLERVATDIRTIQTFKKVFVFEPSDMEKIKGAEFLPYGFDEKIYYKQDLKKIYDVTFVGAGHKERYDPLNRIAEECRKRGIGFFVFGPFSAFKKKPLYKNTYPFLYDSIIHNGRLPPKVINEIYNKSWININIHHSQSKEGVNPRTFEIAGSGNFQLVDEKKILHKLFSIEDEIAVYSEIDDLMEKLDNFLKNKRIIRSVAEKGKRRAHLEHTFYHRARYILDRL